MNKWCFILKPYVGYKIPQAELCSSIKGCHTTFLLILFKEEVAWQPLIKQESCSSSILEPLNRAFKWGIVWLSTNYQILKKLVVISKNVHFYYIKSTFFDISTNISRSYDSRKTNNTSFKCPSWWLQNTNRTALQLSQGLSRNLFLKKYIFYKKVCMIIPNRATRLFLIYFETNI